MTALERMREELENTRRAYEELRKAQAEMVNSARLATLGRLIGGVAHELNTPLGAIHSNHDVIRRSLSRLQRILADERVDEDELAEVRRIVRAMDGVLATNGVAVERMVEIVGTLRSFGRPDGAEWDRVDLHQGLEDSLALLECEAGRRIRLERDFGDLPAVECRPQRLNQVFMNLLLNACQAIPEEGTITVRTRADGEEAVRVEISDNGVGIPAEDLERIFEPGFTTKGKRMGMGIGLLISRQIVEEHGGRIEVRSRQGEGSVFTVVLPLTARDRSTAGR